MSKQFKNENEAKQHFAAMLKVPFQQLTFTLINPTQLELVQTIAVEDSIFSSPDIPAALKEGITKRRESTRYFEVLIPTKDRPERAKIAISPFRSGFDLWFVSDDGSALRI